MSSAPLCDPSVLSLPPPDLKDAGKPSFATCSDPKAEWLSGSADREYGLPRRGLLSLEAGGASTAVGVAGRSRSDVSSPTTMFASGDNGFRMTMMILFESRTDFEKIT
jgi:hypothetical protein